MIKDDIKLCNCAKCGAECLGESMADLAGKAKSVKAFRKLPLMVAGRVDGRPYCVGCIKAAIVRKELSCR